MRLTNKLLQEALTAILNRYDVESDEHEAIIEGLIQLKELKQQMKDDSLWKDEVSIISTGANGDIVNMLYYATYGRLKKANGTVSFEMFKEVVRNSLLSEDRYFPTVLLRDGFDFLSDLWADNEALGCNNPDGSFNPNSGRF